jgi:NAD(P)-dependent dehydrogenase (short-subunit alcohol dehydrogenase family)
MAPRTDSLCLANKIAIVTGSGKENCIGAKITRTLAQARARIDYVSDATGTRAVSVVAEIETAYRKGSAILVHDDISIVQGAKKIVDETLSGFGVDRIDILGKSIQRNESSAIVHLTRLMGFPIVNKAAAGQVGSALSFPAEEIAKVFQVNVFGIIHLIEAAVPHMPRGGRIINIGSIGSKLRLDAVPIYGAAKAAMDALTFSISQEVMPFPSLSAFGDSAC